MSDLNLDVEYISVSVESAGPGDVVEVTVARGDRGETGPAGPSGVVTVSPPLMNAGTSSAASISISLGDGLNVVDGELAADYTGPAFAAAVVAVSPPASWSTLTGKPSTFTPSSHAASHRPTGADPLFDQALNQASNATFNRLTVKRDGGAAFGNPDGNACFVIDSSSNATNMWLNVEEESDNATIGFTAGGAFYHGMTWTPGEPDAGGGLSHSRLTLTAQGAAGSPLDGLIIDASDNVGIGVTAPAVKLDVAGSVAVAKTSDPTARAVLSASGISTATTRTLTLPNASGTLALTSDIPVGYTLPTATGSVLGGVKIGGGVTITDGVISVSTNYAAATHSHAWSAITSGLPTTLSGYGITDGVTTSDSRLTDARTPTDGSVTAAKIASGAVTSSKLASSIGVTSVTATNYFCNGSYGVPSSGFSVAPNSSISSAFFTIDTAGVVTLGTWQATTIAVAYGGTGATTASGARTNLGLGSLATLSSVSDTEIASGGLSASSVNWVAIADWAPSTAYAKGALVNYLGVAYRRSVAGTSGSTFTTSNWQQVTPSTGTSSSTLAAGDHTHSQLHDRSHAITSTSDHTAGNWKTFYSNGSGQLIELAVGAANTVLTSAGTSSAPTFSALPSGGSTNVWIPASALIPRTTNGPGVDSRETSTNKQNWDEVLFDAAAIEYADALVMMPSNYNAGTIAARFYWTAASGSGDVIFGIAGRAFSNDDALDTAYGTAQTATDTLLAANDMHVTSATSAVTIGGAPAANTPTQFTIYRNATDNGDTLAVDARLLGVELIYTAA